MQPFAHNGVDLVARRRRGDVVCSRTAQPVLVDLDSISHGLELPWVSSAICANSPFLLSSIGPTVIGVPARPLSSHRTVAGGWAVVRGWKTRPRHVLVVYPFREFLWGATIIMTIIM